LHLWNRDIFSPIFFSGLLLLGALNWLDPHPDILASLAGPVFIAALLLYYVKRFNGTYLLLVLSFILLLGNLFLEHKARFTAQSDYPLPSDQYISIRGCLTDYPDIRNGYSVIHVRSQVLEFKRKQITATLNIRVKIRGDLTHLFRGDDIIVQARVFENRYHENFENSPFRNYNLYRNIHFSGYSKSSRLVRRVSGTGLIWKILGRWRNRLRHIIEEKWLDGSGELDRRGVFLEAILLGERGRMTPEQKESLLSSGIFHLFAISGAHIGIIAILIFLFLKLLKFRLKPRIMTTLFVLILFLALSGFKISAQRAVIMAAIILMGRIFHLRAPAISVISLSGLIILFVHPAEFLDPGFVLTFALTLSIVLGRRIFCGLFKRIPGYAGEFISANLSASLTSLPLSLFFFKRYSPAGFFAGLVLLPLTAVIIGLGLLTLLLASFWSAGASALLHVNNLPLLAFFEVVDFFSHVVRLNVFRASPGLILTALTILLFWAIGFKKRFRGQRIMVFIGFLVCLAWIAAPSPRYRPGNLELYFFDVGQGDSALAVFPTGQSLLIDGGGSYYSDFEVGKNLVLPFILQKRIRVDWVAVSHFHPDHCRGISEIIDILRPGELWISSEAGKDTCFRRLMSSLDRGTKIRRVWAPFLKQVGNCRIRFLHPLSFGIYDHTHNNHSQVIRISGPCHSFLFTGDIERGPELHLAKNSCAGLGSTVIKIPHHGSKSSSAAAFIRCVNPRIALFSCAQDNRFKFPHPMVLDRLKRQRIRWLSTARRGGICFRSRKEGLEIDVTR
jgi:competence protein ComEC